MIKSKPYRNLFLIPALPIVVIYLFFDVSSINDFRVILILFIGGCVAFSLMLLWLRYAIPELVDETKNYIRRVKKR